MVPSQARGSREIYQTLRVYQKPSADPSSDVVRPQYTDRAHSSGVRASGQGALCPSEIRRAANIPWLRFTKKITRQNIVGLRHLKTGTQECTKVPEMQEKRFQRLIRFVIYWRRYGRGVPTA